MSAHVLAAARIGALIALITGITHAQGPPDAARVVGTWRLTTFEDRSDEGAVKHPYGERPMGLLIYDATGHMSIQIMKMPHPKVASGDEEKITPAEKIALFDAYTAYWGKYRVDTARGVVIHRAEGDLSDVYIGEDEERPFELTGDRLTIRPTWMADGRRWTGVRVFERVR